MASPPISDQTENNANLQPIPQFRGPPSPTPDRHDDVSTPSDAIRAASELNLPDLLRGIVRSCCHLVEADYGVLTVMGPGDQAIEVGYVGVDTWSQQHGATTRPTSVHLVTQLSSLVEDQLDQPGPQLFVNIPVRRRGDVIGHLGLGAKHDQTGFTENDQTVAVSLAAVASNAIELAVTIKQRQRPLTLVDGSDDVDAIIRDLLRLGFELHRLTARVTTADRRATMFSTVDTVDQAIRQIRLTAFAP